MHDSPDSSLFEGEVTTVVDNVAGGGADMWPKRSYAARRALSDRTRYASVIALNRSDASSAALWFRVEGAGQATISTADLACGRATLHVQDRVQVCAHSDFRVSRRCHHSRWR